MVGEFWKPSHGHNIEQCGFDHQRYSKSTRQLHLYSASSGLKSNSADGLKILFRYDRTGDSVRSDYDRIAEFGPGEFSLCCYLECFRRNSTVLVVD